MHTGLCQSPALEVLPLLSADWPPGMSPPGPPNLEKLPYMAKGLWGVRKFRTLRWGGPWWSEWAPCLPDVHLCVGRGDAAKGEAGRCRLARNMGWGGAQAKDHSWEPQETAPQAAQGAHDFWTDGGRRMHPAHGPVVVAQTHPRALQMEQGSAVDGMAWRPSGGLWFCGSARASCHDSGDQGTSGSAPDTTHSSSFDTHRIFLELFKVSVSHW